MDFFFLTLTTLFFAIIFLTKSHWLHKNFSYQKSMLIIGGPVRAFQIITIALLMTNPVLPSSDAQNISQEPSKAVKQSLSTTLPATELKTNTSQDTKTLIQPQKTLIGQAEIRNTPDGSGKNAIIAANSINGTILNPGEIFSFNRIVGQRTPSRGYMNGRTVINTVYGPEYVPGIGGGICKTSTTIHHAVLNAGLKVIERHSHSLPVSYSETGKDAAVAYGHLDYKFKNNTDSPLKIVINADYTKISVKLFQL